MSRLTKQQSKLHAQACSLLQQDSLTFDERLFVLDNWQESANHVNGSAGAFFTPRSLARGLAIETFGGRILDICAGIGSLAFAAYHYSAGTQTGGRPNITCVEINPDYVAVGRKVLPEASWIVADAFDLPSSLGGFECVISNPPFGRVQHDGSAPRYTGCEFEYKIIDIASDLADHGVFLIPQASAPFKLSGIRGYEDTPTDKVLRFSQQSSIELDPNCGIDTAASMDEWHGVTVMTEIALADFIQARSRRRTAAAAVQPETTGLAQQSVSQQQELFASA